MSASGMLAAAAGPRPARNRPVGSPSEADVTLIRHLIIKMNLYFFHLLSLPRTVVISEMVTPAVVTLPAAALNDLC